MREFGSDFHYIHPGYLEENTIKTFFPTAQYYADGRQALIALYKHQGWRRLWVPEYFCYEVLDTMEAAGIQVGFYMDLPECDDVAAIKNIPFEEGDALLRMNFFGLRKFRSNEGIGVPVVEDHTHDLIGGWSRNSDADWCVASLRKTLPIAEGGMLWSPKGVRLPPAPTHDTENANIAFRRWNAMKLKARYISGENNEKSAFRHEMTTTEAYFDIAPISAVDSITKAYLDCFDIRDWYNRKEFNWHELNKMKTRDFRVLVPECIGSNSFSYTILCRSHEYRNTIRHSLIQHGVYPAILWDVPENVSSATRNFSTRMLSIHCDARYAPEDVIKMKNIIESIL